VPLTQTSSGTSITLIANSTRLSNLGSVVGVASTATGTSAIRIHSNGVLDTVASTGQSAPGTSGATFTSIFDVTTDNNDRASFVAGLSTGDLGSINKPEPPLLYLWLFRDNQRSFRGAEHSILALTQSSSFSR
jgi:hypothetical protein